MDISKPTANNKNNASSISLSPPRGMLDYPPEEMEVQQAVHNALKQVCSSMGFRQYDIPIVEHWEVFAEKSSDELLQQQSYHFNDRAERKLLLRPEITPCLARLAAKNMGNYTMPLRWFTIGRCYRYEKPQKGRLREFHQLNIDILGKQEYIYDIEILQTAKQIMQFFQLNEESYYINWNHRGLANALLAMHNFNQSSKQNFFTLVDRSAKLTANDLTQQIDASFTSQEHKNFFNRYINYSNLETLLSQEVGLGAKQEDFITRNQLGDLLPIAQTLQHINQDKSHKVYRFNPRIVRGFNYYTGLVFEVFEAKGEITRSIFGGGRYGNLVEKYAGKPLPAVGLGMGTHIFTLLLREYNKVPKLPTAKKILLAAQQNHASLTAFCFKAWQILQQEKFIVHLCNVSNVRAAFKKAQQQKCTHIAIVGSEEFAKNSLQVKHLESGDIAEIKI